MFSTNRLASDNFLSGALLGILGGIATKQDLKGTLKLAFEGSIATGFSIKASNDIAQRRYLDAAITLGAGAGILLITNKFFNEKERNEKSIHKQ